MALKPFTRRKLKNLPLLLGRSCGKYIIPYMLAKITKITLAIVVVILVELHPLLVIEVARMT